MANRKRIRLAVGAVVVAAAAAAAGVASAYFTASGTGVGSGSVGTASSYSVSTGLPTGTMYPGTGTSAVSFTVTNQSAGHENLSTVAASIMTAANGDAETVAGTDIAGCQASWFVATPAAGDPALPVDLAPNGTYSGTVDVTMTDASVDQGACQGAQPGVVVSAH